MKCGALVYATDSGLGVLARAFVRHGVITHPLVVRHGRHPTHDDWFPSAPQVADLRRQRGLLRDFVRGLDVFLALETPFDWTLFPYCREHGVKTVLQTQYECTPERLPAEPDLFLCPSLLDLRYYPERSVFLPVPVEVPWRRRERAEVFVANLGHGGLRGRNGGRELLEAIQHVKSPARFIIRYQSAKDLLLPLYRAMSGRAEMRAGTVPYEQLWADGGEGDALIHCTKFDGLSLPLQEARAAGMLCLTGDRFPMNTWLPPEPLIPVREYRKARIGPPYNFFDEAVYDPRDIAACIDRWYDQDISAYSEQGREWAESMSWAALRPRYIELLEGLTHGRIP